jgi:hypothetical protein
VSNNSTRSRLGLRLGQEGRQKIPVERTAYTNTPSAWRSRVTIARQLLSALAGVRSFCVCIMRPLSRVWPGARYPALAIEL